jgi:hypothetical protein
MKTILFFDPLLAMLEGVTLPRLEWLAVCLSLIGLVHYGRVLCRKLPVRWWSRTRGRILKVELRKSQRRQTDGSIVYEPVIRYAYSVGDRILEGRRISAENSVGALTFGLRMMKTYQPGTEVPVFYHPMRPNEAVLQFESVRSHAMRIAVLGVLLCWVLVRLFWA